jgi:uncharacterized cysteine cluster protein YcgN (CxxCxxCC family)
MAVKKIAKTKIADELTPRFWEVKTLEQMNSAEWEALCDGCGKCCLNKFQDEDTDEVHFTNVACRYLDLRSLRCRCWEDRAKKVLDCVVLTPDLVRQVNWLPETCAYRVLAEGQPLADWHPLNSGNRASVAVAGVSVRGKIISEREVNPDDLEDYIVQWIS